MVLRYRGGFGVRYVIQLCASRSSNAAGSFSFSEIGEIEDRGDRGVWKQLEGDGRRWKI